MLTLYKPKWRTDLETSYGDERTNYKSLTPEMSLNKCQVWGEGEVSSVNFLLSDDTHVPCM